MTLLITILASVISTILWYKNLPNDTMKLGTLTLIYWGASLMWLVDAIAEYVELQSEFFTPTLNDMLNDAFLGISVVVLGLIIWLTVLILKDPQGKIISALVRTDKNRE
ncbi:MAG: hypothetical protein LIO71_02015 [Ruminococcus sp.]|nr:hypothetical protein [Ruminococcus sp.]MCD7799815.1 hypothetical protein [Ruminococcus sp.]